MNWNVDVTASEPEEGNVLSLGLDLPRKLVNIQQRIIVAKRNIFIDTTTARLYNCI